MAARGDQMCVGLEAASDLSALQYRVVRVVANNAVNIASQSSVARAMGILQDTPSSGQACRVAFVGETKAVAGAAIANVGVQLSHTASGTVIAATSGLCVIGYNLEAAGADLDVIRILLTGAPGVLGQV